MKKFITIATDDLERLLELASEKSFAVLDSVGNTDGEGKWHCDVEFFDEPGDDSPVEVFSFNKSEDNYSLGVYSPLQYTIDPDYTPLMFSDEQDPCLNYKRVVKLATGEGWHCLVASRGEMRAKWTNPETGEEIWNEEIFDKHLKNDRLVQLEQEAGRLVFDNNNWFEIEFYKTGDPDQTPEYLDLLADDCVCYSYNEAYDRFIDYVEDEQFIKELTEEINKNS